MVSIDRICRTLSLGADGIWFAGSETSSVSYPEDGSDLCRDLEDASFWFKHRNACILQLISCCPPPDDGPILDVGGGNGFVSQALVESGRDAILLEPSIAGARNAKARNLPNVICATLEDAQFMPRSLSAAGLFDVVEHIEDDLGFLRSLRELLKPGGKLYINVPAYSFLWSHEDESAGHYRRYTLSGLTARTTEAGFETDYGTYIFRPLPLPILLCRALPSKLGMMPATDKKRLKKDHVSSETRLGRLVDALFSPEVGSIRRQRPLAFGASCLLAVTRP